MLRTIKQDKKHLKGEEGERLRRERETDEEQWASLVNTKFDQHKIKPDFVFPSIDWLGAEKLRLQHLIHPSPRSQPCRRARTTIYYLPIITPLSNCSNLVDIGL